MRRARPARRNGRFMQQRRPIIHGRVEPLRPPDRVRRLQPTACGLHGAVIPRRALQERARSCAGRALGQQVADDDHRRRHPPRSPRPPVSSVMPPMATRERPPCASARRPLGRPAPSDRRVARGFGLRAEHRADRDVVDRAARQASSTCSGVWVESPMTASGPTSARASEHRQVVLSEVDVPGAGDDGDVHAIVDDDPRLAGAARDRLGPREDVPCGGVLGSHLQESDASLQVRVRQVRDVPAGTARDVGIDNGVEPGRKRPACGGGHDAWVRRPAGWPASSLPWARQGTAP